MKQAKENLEEATVLFENNKYKGASNRAYYSIFHVVKAVLPLEQTDFKKYSSVIAYLNKDYISKDIFPKELGKRVSEARFYKEKSDYVDFYIITKEECNLQIETAKMAIDLVGILIKRLINSNIVKLFLRRLVFYMIC